MLQRLRKLREKLYSFGWVGVWIGLFCGIAGVTLPAVVFVWGDVFEPGVLMVVSLVLAIGGALLLACSWAVVWLMGM